MKNKGLSLTFLVFTLCLFSFAKIAKATPPAGGLWGQYSKNHKESDSSKPDKSELKDVSVENIDFDNFDEVLKQRIGQRDDAEIIWRGGIYADSDGEYIFRLDVETSETVKLTIDDKSVWKQNVAGDRWGKITLKKGWHRFVLWHIVHEGDVDSKASLFWTQPGEKEEIVPKDHLTYKFWSDNVLTIPSDGSKKKLNYIVAGAGVDGEEGSGGLEEGKITVDMPANILDDDVWVVWYKETGESNKLVIKNEHTGDSKTVTGQSNLDSMGFEADYPEVYANVSKSLIVADGNGKLRLSFKKASSSEAAFSNGISLIIPFEDNTKPEGKLSIRMVAATGFRGAGPVMTFPVTPKSKINPMFFFPNGESKTGDDGFRPNYLVMKTGSGTPPKESASLFNDSDTELIVPQVSSSISTSNPKTWYPLYGREGRQLDVISSRYVPNKWSDVASQYSGNQDGKIDEIEIPEGHTWVAFQYVGSNFASDGQDGRPESGSISGGGLFSEKDLDEFDLKVNVTGNGDVTSSVGTINCPTSSCEDDYADGTNVTLTATAHTGSSFAGWSGDCAFAGTNTTCTLTVNSEKNVNATFSLIPTPTVGGICGNANGSAFCSEPKNKCYLGTVVDLQYSESSKKWTWKCEQSGVKSPPCSAQKNCQIQEVTP